MDLVAMSTRPDHSLSQWLRMSNAKTIVLTVLMTLVVVTPSAGVAGDPARLHDLSLAVATMYAVLHGGMLLHARHVSAQQDATSRRTAAYLRDPRRITSLDLAAYWVGLAVIGSLLLARG